MKTYILTLVALFLANFPTKAQEVPKDSSNYIGSHIISIAPLGLIDKIRIRYEYVASKRMTYGAQASYYYDRVFTGFQLVAIARRYISRRSAPFGFYVMGQAGIAYHHATAYDGIYTRSNGGFLSYPSYYYTNSYQVQSFGLLTGIGLGYQRSFGKRKRIILDTYLGLKKCIMAKNLDGIYVHGQPMFFNNFGVPYNKSVFSGKDGTGVGGYINYGINIGYRF
jgi:hypothetical protein